MSLFLKKSNIVISSSLFISGSKSESNRLLILNSFYNIEIKNLSDSDDTISLQNALNSPLESVDIHHAGTAMRFLTAYFTGTSEGITACQMDIKIKGLSYEILVNALKDLGADIHE